jgi:ribose/xylose/arabinose/galactoside ABC-type transport system permease subunit
MSDTKNAIVGPSTPIATSKSASWANWVVGVQGPLLGLILLCVIFTFTTNVFFSVRNALNVLDQVTVLGILAVGMTLVIVIGGIDLSVGSILAFVMMVMGWLKETFNVPLPLAIVIALLGGGVCGLLNGLLVTKARLPAFIATLAMMSIGRGLANIVTDGRQVVGFPDWFTSLSTVRHFGFLSITVALFLVLVVLTWIFLRYRSAGRSLYAIGGSPEVARLAGIKVQALTIWVYVAAATKVSTRRSRNSRGSKWLPSSRARRGCKTKALPSLRICWSGIRISPFSSAVRMRWPLALLKPSKLVTLIIR